jgi:acetyl esterase/lipase
LIIAALVAFPFSSLFAQMGPRDIDALPSTPPTAVEKYGTDRLQFGELRLPEGKGPFPVAVVIHGGCWTAGNATLRNTAALASELTKHKIATWNIEYREVGDAGGGWPGTFLDWGAAVDHLRVLAKTYPLDLNHVVVIGHSAGAHAALWVAARHRLPADSKIRGTDPLPIHASVAIDGPGDLIHFNAGMCGGGSVYSLLGGSPQQQPLRYQQASAQSLLPLGIPQYLIAAEFLPPFKAQEYQKLAQAKDDHVEVLIPHAGHFDLIAPGTPAGQAVLHLILDHSFKDEK